MTLQTLETNVIQFIDPALAPVWEKIEAEERLNKKRIAHAAQADSPVGLVRERMVRLIKTAGRVPVERDALFNELKVYA
ncbi:MAG TPA: hypothetical protein EYQ82_11780 [Dehalococcoidia bacterium]|nr:hypothetical protein [Dehalococcoidia bacterium]